jgi:drug/metabolite transporter (DMT)-like permease|tara:strand:+ start:1488 stop:2324 length:837 start_codon:yes stop_codon:yes gene_type:complete
MKSSTSYILLITAALMWSLGGVFIKLVDLNPMGIAGIRSLGAAVVLLIYIKKPRLYWNRYFLTGVLAYTAMVVLYVLSIRLTTAANAIFLEFTAPIYVVAFSYLLLNERINRFDILTMVIIFLGMGLFFMDELTFYGFWGNIMALIAGVCLALVTVMIRKEKESAFEIVFYGNVLTAIICFTFIIEGLSNSTQLDWLIIFGLGIFQLGIPYILYTTALKYVSALDAILVGMLEPILNPIWVYIFIGEAMGEWAFIGGALVIIGTLGRVIIKQKLKVIL